MNQSATSTRMPANDSDLALFQKIESELYTAVICDALDDLGYRHQAMHERLRPLFRDISFAGWVRTISCVDVSHIPK
jgi:4-hydroxy-4-methyl-2-oxoglutarate aldolase